MSSEPRQVRGFVVSTSSKLDSLNINLFQYRFCMSVTIRIKDRDYTVDEARKIYDELAKLFKPKNNGLSYPGEQQKGLFPKYPFDTGQPIWTTQPLTFADSLASVDRLPT